MKWKIENMFETTNQSIMYGMPTWLGYIDGIHVTIHSSTMDPSWVIYYTINIQVSELL